MKFDKILEYQDLDQKVIALEAELSKSDERARFLSAKSRVDAATGVIGKLSQEANDLLGGYVKMKTKLDQLKAKLDEFNGIIEGVEDENEADYYIKQVGAIADEIISLERESSLDASKIDEVNSSFKKTWDQGTEASLAYKNARAGLEKITAEKQPQFKEYTAKLSELKAEIPAEILEIYNALRQQKKMPAFVVHDLKSDICDRCRMDLPNDAKARLKKTDDYTECPNCHRILFVPEQ